MVCREKAVVLVAFAKNVNRQFSNLLTKMAGLTGWT